MQKAVDKEIVTEKRVQKSNLNGMGSKVGTITNRGTSMMEVQSRFPKGSKEWNDLQYRIDCVQTYQQDEIDHIKGIKTKPMPANWFNIAACEGDEYKKSICADKRPYFMKYARPDYSAKYNTFLKNEQMRCNIKFHMPVKELLDRYFNGEIIGETEEEKNQLEFVRWFIAKSPLGTGACSMNKVCWHIEERLDPYKIELHATSGFDYTKLKVKRRCTNEHREQLKDAYNYYMERMKVIAKDSSTGKIDMSEYVREHDFMVRNVRERIEGLCPSEEERLNIILDMRYKDNCNQSFMWSMVGSLICDRLAELEREGELA